MCCYLETAGLVPRMHQTSSSSSPQVLSAGQAKLAYILGFTRNQHSESLPTTQPPGETGGGSPLDSEFRELRSNPQALPLGPCGATQGSATLCSHSVSDSLPTQSQSTATTKRKSVPSKDVPYHSPSNRWLLPQEVAPVTIVTGGLGWKKTSIS